MVGNAKSKKLRSAADSVSRIEVYQGVKITQLRDIGVIAPFSRL